MLMITVNLNNNMIIINATTLLSDLLLEHGFTSGAFAVAINRQFVPRGNYMKTTLNEGDVIDIVTPMQGG